MTGGGGGEGVKTLLGVEISDWKLFFLFSG